jgi:FAD/FMN-containing dehydrogenase
MLNPCDTDFVERLARDLPEGTLAKPEARHLEEPRGRWTGQAGALARPRTTEEVARIVRACAGARVGVVPWSGGTGLVGGQILTQGPAPVLLSLERMTALRGVYPAENAMVVEAGMILADVQAAVAGVRGQLPDRGKPRLKRRGDRGFALWQCARPVSGVGGGAAGWQRFQRVDAASEG